MIGQRLWSYILNRRYMNHVSRYLRKTVEGMLLFNLTGNEAVSNAAYSGTSISLNGGTKETQITHLGEDAFVKF